MFIYTSFFIHKINNYHLIRFLPEKQILENASFNSQIIGDNIAQYKKIANGKRNVVFAVSRKHGRSICQRYVDEGICAEFLDGETSDKERKRTLGFQT